MKKIIIFTILVSATYANSLLKENVRYFGGYSENKVNIIKSKVYTAPLVITEEVFNAKKSEDIDKAIETQQELDIASGVTAREFLKERTGHLYGGFSENKLDLKTIK